MSKKEKIEKDETVLKNCFLMVSQDKSRAILLDSDKMNTLKKYRRLSTAFKGSIIRKKNIDVSLMQPWISDPTHIVCFHYFEDFNFYSYVQQTLKEIQNYFVVAYKGFHENSSRFTSTFAKKEYQRSLFPTWFTEFAISHLGTRRISFPFGMKKVHQD